MTLIRIGFAFGIIVWAAATAVFVPLGHLVFGPDNRLPVVFSASVTVAGTFVGFYYFALRALRRTDSVGLERGALLGVSACLPGLVLDGALYAFNAGRYPGLDAAASGVMSAGLLLAYAAALLAALGAARFIGRSA